MKRLLRTIPVFFAFLLIISTLLAGPGLQLGRVSLARAPAPALKIAAPINMRSAGFVARVGGVAFGQVATPDPTLVISKLDLAYDATKPDGLRAVLRLDGAPIEMDLHDWQLMPIARFADSKQPSAITAFGNLQDSKAQEKVVTSGGKIINYHPALANTLLGLRLMQADIMLFVPDAIDLPMEGGMYLLGAGETQPDLTQNQAGWLAFDKVNRAADASFGHYRSYVLSDEGVPITFSVASGRLSIKGEPVYHFWRFRGESPMFSKASESTRIRAEIMARLTAAQSDPKFSQTNWLIAEILTAVDRISQLADSRDRLSPARRQQLTVGLKKGTTDELTSLLEELLVKLAASEVDVMTQYTNQVSKPGVVSAINPTVYDAARTTMRYAAFFRYLRDNHPGVWKKFLGSVSWRAIKPAVQTPTTMSL